MAIIWLADYCSITRQLHGVTQGSRKQNHETARYSVLLAQSGRKPHALDDSYQNISRSDSLLPKGFQP